MILIICNQAQESESLDQRQKDKTERNEGSGLSAVMPAGGGKVVTEQRRSPAQLPPELWGNMIPNSGAEDEKRERRSGLSGSDLSAACLVCVTGEPQVLIM